MLCYVQLIHRILYAKIYKEKFMRTENSSLRAKFQYEPCQQNALQIKIDNLISVNIFFI